MASQFNRRVSRRDVLKMMGAGAAGLALASCAPTTTPTPVGPTKAAAAVGPTQAGAAALPTPIAGTAGQKIIQVAYTREIDVLNPFTSQMLCDIEFTMMEGLIQNNEKNESIPILATEIPTIANGGIVDMKDGTYEMTWHLQPNVKWHDGVPFTSKDVYFTWKFVSDPNSQTYNSDDYSGITDCKMPDDNTVVFVWNGLYGLYDGIFEAVLPEHVLGKLSVAEIVQNTQFNRSPIGTGPFKFAEWKSGEYIRVVKNENYWRGAQYPEVDEMVFSFIPDDNTRLAALQTGQYHIGQILPVQVAQLKNNPYGTVKLIPSDLVDHLDLNVNSSTDKNMFGDVNVRQAIYHAIDRNAIANQLMQGTVTVVNSVLNPDSVWYNTNVTNYNYDVALSQKMLAAAGWVAGSDGILVKNGQRFSFTLLERSGKQDWAQIAQVIQAELKAVGIEVKISSIESVAWTNQWRSGKWDAVVAGWFLASDPSVTAIYECGGSNNYTGFCDPNLDTLMKQSDKNLDVATRKPLIDQVLLYL
jgi:peptide/nickel transport system substrate-binding protein